LEQAMRTQGVIFDIDGTLVDSVEFHALAWQKAFAKHGYRISFTDLKQHIGKGGEQIVASFVSDSEFDQVVEPISRDRKEIYQQEFLPQVQPFADVPALFHRLKSDNIQIILASSARPNTVDHYIDLLNVEHLIDGATSTGDVEHAKPQPDIFISALQKLKGISPDQVLVIGDSPYDAQAAKKVPLPTVGVRCGGFDESWLRQAGCVTVYQDPADLLIHYPEWLDLQVLVEQA
jgi:HAD superfamily hydrolase (TIGR01549 family)